MKRRSIYTFSMIMTLAFAILFMSFLYPTIALSQSRDILNRVKGAVTVSLSVSKNDGSRDAYIPYDFSADQLRSLNESDLLSGVCTGLDGLYKAGDFETLSENWNEMEFIRCEIPEDSDGQLICPRQCYCFKAIQSLVDAELFVFATKPAFRKQGMLFGMYMDYQNKNDYTQKLTILTGSR